MDLGQKQSKTSKGPVEASSSKNKVYYPSFSLRDKLKDKFLEEHDVNFGETLTLTIKAQISGVSKQEYDNSITFELHSLECSTHEKEKTIRSGLLE